MGFTTDYNDVSEQGIMPIGDYEMVISDMEMVTNSNGNTSIKTTLIVRNDLDQAYKNKNLWRNMWKAKQPNENDCKVGGFQFRQIMEMSKAAKLPTGVNYETLDDWFRALLHKPVRVTLKHSEYNGKSREEISYVNETKFPECKHVFKVQPTIPEYSVEDDSTLPF